MEQVRHQEPPEGAHQQIGQAKTVFQEILEILDLQETLVTPEVQVMLVHREEVYFSH
jgi:hypothetical protein